MESSQPSQFQMYWIQYRSWFFFIGVVVLLFGMGSFVTQGFINVPEGHAMVLIRKTGVDLKSGQIIATKPGVKGIHLKVYPEGWHFLNPYVWEGKVFPKFEVPEGKVGVVVRLFGKPLPPGRVIAGPGEKGILAKVLRPGLHTINPYAYKVKLYDKVSVPPGYVGVVVLVSGKEPKNPNVFVTNPGERGVQKETLDVGDYYINPFIKRIVPVDVRAHKSELVGKRGGIAFPSKDGFFITMDATIEWYIDSNRVPEIFVKYVDNHNNVIKNVIEKIILPYARSFSRIEGSTYLAREFIGGQTRQRFQEAFLKGMRAACAKLGIQIRSALVKNVVPPAAIVNPIQKREITIRMRDQYLQQMEREKQQKKLAITQALQVRARRLNKAQADVSVAITRAEQQKEVAIINARKQLDYARKQLQATKDLVKIILARGQAKAKVIELQNKARAAGLRHSVSAFGSGQAFVRYLYYKRLASSYRYILANTNGPFMWIFQEVGRDLSPKTKASTQMAAPQAPKDAKKGGK